MNPAPVVIDLAPSGKLVVNFGHTVEIPANDAGLQYLLMILQARHRTPAFVKVGMEGAPTQAQVDAFFKKQAKKEQEALNVGPINLEELGL